MLLAFLRFCPLILIFWSTPFFLEEIDHKFYVSTTTIEYNPKATSLQISAQVFTEDLETALREKNPQFSLDPDSNPALINQNIADYFKEKLQFFVEGTELDYDFLGKEYVNDITKCYLELHFKKTPEKIELFNRLFFTLFEEQQNIVHFKNSTQRKSYLLHQKEPTVTLSLAR